MLFCASHIQSTLRKLNKMLHSVLHLCKWTIFIYWAISQVQLDSWNDKSARGWCFIVCITTTRRSWQHKPYTIYKKEQQQIKNKKTNKRDVQAWIIYADCSELMLIALITITMNNESEALSNNKYKMNQTLHFEQKIIVQLSYIE